MSTDFQNLREEHVKLLVKTRSDAPQETLMKEAHALLEKMRLAGRYITDQSERQRVETYAAFWGSVIFEEEKNYPNTEIEPIDKALQLEETKYFGLPEGESRADKRACPIAPPPLPVFAGREDEMGQLVVHLESVRPKSIMAVQGMGGIGKTSLVRQLAQVGHDRKIIAAVFWADMSSNPDPRQQLLEWAQYADPQFVLPDIHLPQLAARVRALITDLVVQKCPGRTLVVLDDVWEESLPVARLLIDAAPSNASVVITTRSQRVTENLHCEVINLTTLSLNEAEDLLCQLIGHPDVTEADKKELADLLGGHPLALALAASNLNLAYDRADIEDLIRQCRRSPFEDGLLIAPELGAEESKTGSQAVTFQLSYERLNPELQRCFRALGILAPNALFNAELASAVWQVSEDIARGLLNELRIRSLISSTERSGWVNQHILLRAYAQSLLQEIDETSKARQSYEEKIIELAMKGLGLSPQGWSASDFLMPHVHFVGNELNNRIRKALGNLDSFIQPKINADLEIPIHKLTAEARQSLLNGYEFARAVVEYVYYHREIGEEGQSWLRMGLAAARILGYTEPVPSFINGIGLWNMKCGHRQIAIRYFEEAISLSREEGDRITEAKALINLAGAYFEIGQPLQSSEWFQQALTIFKETGSRLGEAITLNNLATLYHGTGRPQQALNLYQEVLPIFREIGFNIGEAKTLNNLAHVFFDMGRPQQALALYCQALPLILEGSNRAGEAETLHGMAQITFVSGQIKQALQQYEQALAIRREINDQAGIAETLFGTAQVHFAMGQTELALIELEQARTIYHEIQNIAGEARTMVKMAGVYNSLAQSQQAQVLLDRAQPTLHNLDDRAGEADALVELAALYYRMQKPPQQVQNTLEQALAIRQGLNDRIGQANILSDLARIDSDSGKIGDSLDRFMQALSIMQQTGYKVGEATIAASLGRILFIQKDRVDDAISYMKQAIDILYDIGLSQDATGRTIEEMESELTEMEADAD